MYELDFPNMNGNADELQKVRIAYALNMCAVSVSQIIDYDDLYVMEQEYDAVLNNLNLEKMPKDEPFLKILTELLNVITFFRIYDKKKDMIERKYQQQIRNSIWSAVPNLALIISSGNPYVMATSLVTQVGIGYMNYRKNRADMNLEYDSNKMELELTAIEQLNALRCELFTTSWRLADKYNFNDKYRLTERQIAQYNDILMDKDIVRRYNRLYTIRENFVAYPPFWYYLGNAANQISQLDDDIYTDEYREYNKEIACKAFEYYISLNEEFSILRDDELVSSCALEYCDLLPSSQKEKKLQLLDIAVKWSGQRRDVLQLCAMGLLGTQEYSKAEAVLKRLVNEDYNTEINAQILSSIYANQYFNNPNEKIAFSHRLLAKQEPEVTLFQLPIGESVGKSREELWNTYIMEQINVIKMNTKNTLGAYFDGFTYKLNEMLFAFDATETYPDRFFLPIGQPERDKEAQRVFTRALIKTEYINSIKGVSYTITLVDMLNGMLKGLRYLPMLQLENAVSELEEKVSAYSEKFEELQECLYTENITYESYKEIFEPLTFDLIIEDFCSNIYEQVDMYLDTIIDMNGIISAQMILEKFVAENNVIFLDDTIENSELVEEEEWFSIKASSVGRTAFSLDKESKHRDVVLTYLKDKLPLISKDDLKVHVIFRGEEEFEQYFTKRGNILDKNSVKDNLKEQTLAIVDEIGGLSSDIIFTYNSIVPCYAHKILPHVEYKLIRYNMNKNQLIIGNLFYSSKYVDVMMLARCIEDICSMKDEMDAD